MRRYETIFILRPNLGEDEINRVVDYATEIITSDGGNIIDLNRWGMKKLAYLIKKESLGYYVFCDYAGKPSTVSEMERRFRIDDSVMKYMTIKIDNEIDEESIQQAIIAAADKIVPNDDDEDADVKEESDDEENEDDLDEESEESDS